MPRNNPYDRELDGARKIISDIGFILTVLFVVGFIIFFIVRQPKNVRTSFDRIETPISFASNKNEFKSFISELGKPLGIDAEFKNEYPTVTALLKKDEAVYTENTPYIADSGSCVTLALAYNNTSDKEKMTMDILLLPYEKADGRLKINAPERYTVSYSDGIIEQKELRKQNFRLSFYKLTAEFENSAALNYEMKLSSPLSNKEAETGGLFKCIRSAEGDSGGMFERLESSSVITGDFQNSNMISLSFNDLLYDYFESITVTLPEGTAKIRFN